jgi:hypothetical protein
MKRDMSELLMAAALHWMPEARREWGAAMLAGLAQLQHPFTRWQFALGVRAGGAVSAAQERSLANCAE